VLLAEDNEINQQVAREILEGAGLNVSIANDGGEALRAVQKSPFDAVLMDIQMPVMDGHEATIEIRKDDRFRELPIIAMTAHAMAGDMEKSLEAGMNDHVTKPIDPDQLFAALRKWIPAKGGRHVEAKPWGLGRADEGEEIPLPESLPGFDLAAGLKRLQGNEGLYKKLLGRLATDYSGAADDIRKALAAQEMGEAHGLVHGLKGAAGNLGATDVHATAAELENLIKEVDKDKLPSPDAVEAKLAALEGALSEAVESLQILGPAAAGQAAEPSAESLTSVAAALDKDAAERIRNAAEIGEINQLTAIAEELKSQSDSFAPFCHRVIQLARDFDFDGIINMVNEVEETRS
jgi:CheY-like chemotaxis protein/HPt (histidine-containing phosphotransfer) domain-containing protein